MVSGITFAGELVRDGAAKELCEDWERWLRCSFFLAITLHQPVVLLVVVCRENALLGLPKHSHHVAFQLRILAPNALVHNWLASQPLGVAEVLTHIVEAEAEAGSEVVLVHGEARSDVAEIRLVDQHVQEGAAALRKVNPGPQLELVKAKAREIGRWLMFLLPLGGLNEKMKVKYEELRHVLAPCPALWVANAV